MQQMNKNPPEHHQKGQQIQSQQQKQNLLPFTTMDAGKLVVVQDTKCRTTGT
jgi:hypothetical protein